MTLPGSPPGDLTRIILPPPLAPRRFPASSAPSRALGVRSGPLGGDPRRPEAASRGSKPDEREPIPGTRSIGNTEWDDGTHDGTGARGSSAASRRIRSRITANSRRGTATSAIWNTTYRACVTTFAPILMSFSRSVVSDQCFAGHRECGVKCQQAVNVRSHESHKSILLVSKQARVLMNARRFIIGCLFVDGWGVAGS